MSLAWVFGDKQKEKKHPDPHGPNLDRHIKFDYRHPDFAQSEEEAEQHIRDIQKKLNRLKSNNEILDIDHLLMLVGEGQYSNNSHVFFELIQNAEDTRYEEGPPKISIHYENGYVLFESNEVGFSKANVDSICTATKSSKVGLDGKEGGVIGEKGIGFKSVFRVASTVWISSGHYSFRFDKKERLGTVYPNWDKLPSHIKRREGSTAILMKLSHETKPAEIVHSLKNLDPTIFLFLSKVKGLETSTTTDGEGDHLQPGTGISTWNDSLTAETISSEKCVLSSVSVKKGSEVTEYYAYRYPVTGLPEHELRPGNADITILFPISVKSIQPVKAYAYLPIQDYGFKFTIQSNFILVANRKDIDDNGWNRALIEALPQAILKAVPQFGIQDSDLRYGWPLLLPLEGFKDSVFEHLPHRIKDLFFNQKIVEDANGMMVEPANVTYVPRDYRGADGNPLIPAAHSKRALTSEKYTLRTIKSLNKLGVMVLSDMDFLHDLRYFASSAATEFQAMPDSWHNQVCEVLLTLLEGQKGTKASEYKSKVRQIRLLPLRDGTWISFGDKSTKPFFPPESSKAAVFPKDIRDYVEIRPDITKKSGRGQLFTILNAESPSADTLAWYILYEHKFNTSKIEPSLRPPENAAAHLNFLFHARRRLSDDYIASLLCLTEANEVANLSEVYLPSADKFSATSFPSNPDYCLKFLHSEYLNVLGTEATAIGYNWLRETLGLRTLLRIANPTSNGGYEAHLDLLSLMLTSPMHVLSTLRYHWDYYSAWFETPDPRYNKRAQDAPPNLDEGSRERLRDAVSNMVVTCHGGATAKLKEVYLPLEHLIELSDLASFHPCRQGKKVKACSICETIRLVRQKEKLEESQGVIPLNRFLDVSHAKDHLWDFLQLFGVGVEPDLDLFLSRLKQIQGHNISHLHASKLYSQLGRYLLKPQQDTIRQFFESGAYVYVPYQHGGSTGAWHLFSDCIWHTRFLLNHVPSIGNYYTNQSKLFYTILSPRDVDLKLLKVEASRLSPADGIKHVSTILKTISGCIDHRRGDITTIASDFQDCPMFPVSPDNPTLDRGEYFSGFSSDFTTFRLSTNSRRDQWFISDSMELRKAFQGFVKLSSLPTSFFETTSSTLNSALDLQSRLLSRAVTQDPISAANQRDHIQFSQSLRQKAFYISSLVLHENERLPAIAQLLRARVVECSAIQLSWTLQSGRHRIKSRVESVKSVCCLEGDAIVIYCIPGEVEPGYVPVHLAHQLAKHCNIHRREDETLIYQILTQTNLGRIRENVRARHGESIFSMLEKEFAGVEGGGKDQLKVEPEPDNWLDPPDTETAGEQPMGPKPAEEAEPPSKPKASPHKKIARVEESGDSFPSDQPSLETSDIEVQMKPANLRARSQQPAKLSSIIPRQDRHTDIKEGNFPRSRTTEFLNMNSGVIFRSEPPTFLGEDTQDTRYFGELQVSRFLDSFLGSDVYDPNENWTSPMRSQHGHTSYQSQSPSSSFTIVETNGKLRDLVITKGNVHGSTIEKTCKFHIQVCPTNTGALDPFSLSNVEFEKARRLALDGRGTVNEIYILARVSNVDGDPGIHLYLDPWKLYLEKLLKLGPQTAYQGSTLINTPTILSQESTNKSMAPQTHEIYRNLIVELDEIRLLRLDLTSPGNELRGEFVRVNIESGTPYLAISYCWGRRPDPKTCAYFSTKDGKFPVGDSLAACLRCLKGRKENSLIWADALCINQNNNIEKTRQVRRMGLIYRKANSVMVWMGDERPADNQALEILGRLRQQSAEQAEESSVYQNEVTQIEKFLSREWFTRMWIIQELVLSSKVIIRCGSSQLTWDDFVCGVVECERLLGGNADRGDKKDVQLHGSYRLHALHRARSLYQNAGELFRFLELRKMFFHNRSSRPRDKLFSLFHLAYDLKRGNDDFHPDYDSPDKDVLCRFVEWLASVMPVPNLLYWAGDAKSSEFCSWMPNLMAEKGPEHYTYPQTISSWETTKVRFSAGKLLKLWEATGFNPAPKPSTITLQPTPALNITAVLFDTIQECTSLEVHPTMMYFHRVLAMFRSYIAKLDSYPGLTDNWEDEVLIKTLIGDAPGPLTISASPYFEQPRQETVWPLGFEKEILAIKPNQGAHVYNNQSLESQGVMTQFWATVATFIGKFPRPMVCLTGKGYIGIIPEASAGDNIMIMRDARVPFVIRRDLSGNYKLIGEAYIHGLMYSKESAVFVNSVKSEEITLI
ncbi:hypothetical protein DRE_00429 [Drechslerella stenobrocha 248]|uniref:Heterokaryon incompatibility domain-containing protein n=1 Tax=Drechslerella stenobrocha 248 TaxID=1043628 RepID=W7HTM7_9PEZI|nr:hypothetical protein DRE_00429 [Drechslerella stenobrocha 248]